MFFYSMLVIAVVSTGLILILRDWKPRNETP